MLASMRAAVEEQCGLPSSSGVQLNGLGASQLIPDPAWREDFVSGYDNDGFFAGREGGPAVRSH